MSKKKLLITIVLVFICLIALLELTQNIINAQETRIIRIYGGVTPQTQDIRIEPQTLWISKGTVVIWNNWVRTQEVKINFREGKKCEDVTEAPTGFKLDATNCYVTTYLPLGATSSLKFNEEGTFAYTVEISGGKSAKGEIVVH